MSHRSHRSHRFCIYLSQKSQKSQKGFSDGYIDGGFSIYKNELFIIL